VRDTSDIANIVVGSQNGVPTRIGDIGQVVIGNAPRLGEFGFNKTDDAVEGVIMMRRGEQTQNVLKGVEAKTQELNEHLLPPDVKVRAYYDRSDLVQLTIDTVEHNLLIGMTLVLIVLMAFLVSMRAAVIVALTIPLSLLFSFIFLHAEGIPANLLSIGAIDFGILIDGTLVMVENIFRELGAREGQQYDLEEVIKNAAKDVDRPIFYSVAVIIAGYLPIYALTGPSGKLFKPMADTVAIALVGAMILTLTLVPVLCALWFKKGVHEKENKPFEWILRKYAVWLDWCLDRPRITLVLRSAIFAAALLLIPFIGGEFMPHLDEGALWIRATMPYTVSFETASSVFAAGAGHPDEVPDGDGCGFGAGAARRRHRSDRVLQRRVLRRAEAV
jgi:cobalt-zinc-cadmium resistance protein CzcA